MWLCRMLNSCRSRFYKLIVHLRLSVGDCEPRDWRRFVICNVMAMRIIIVYLHRIRLMFGDSQNEVTYPKQTEGRPQ